MYSMSNLGKLKVLDANAPDAMKAFWAFDKAAMADGAIPIKYKELMALAVAFTTQCPYCIEIHSGKARKGQRNRSRDRRGRDDCRGAKGRRRHHPGSHAFLGT